jgi:hypothetical protein
MRVEQDDSHQFGHRRLSLMPDAKPLAAELFHGIIAFIADDSDFALEEAAGWLREAFPQQKVSPHPQGITVAAEQWRLWLDYVDGPHVASESQEMAKWLTEHPAAGQISGCKRRVEFSGTDIEPGSDCFGALCGACAVLKGFRNIVVFDLEDRNLFC